MHPFDQRHRPDPGPSITLIATPAHARAVAGEFERAGLAPPIVAAPGEPATPAALIVADAHGCDPDRLDQMLDLLNALPAGQAAILAFSFDQIDAVAAGLTHPGIRLLCDPTAAEFSGALTPTGGVREPGDDSDSERLRRIDAEVARIAEVLARLTGAGASDATRDRDLGYVPPPAAPAAPAAEVDSRLVRRVIRARRLRTQFLDPALFADPAWDMLLDLYAAELDRGQVSVSSLCIAAAVPPTTALRWIGMLVDRGLFRREADPFDRRRIHIALTERASDAMRRYFAAAGEAGLTLVA